MQLGICGFGYSGSGAVLDLLKDYPSVVFADRVELSFAYKPDGLNDLKRALCIEPSRHWSSDTAIRRFIKYMKRQSRIYNRVTNGQFGILSNDFIKQIIQVEWPGYTGTHYYQGSCFDYWFNQILALHVRVLIEKFFRPLQINTLPQKTMYYAYMNEQEFDERAYVFVQKVLESITGETDKIVASDQLFSANRPQNSFPYFNEPKAIVVMRDPRDTYLLAKSAVGIYSKFIPVNNVESFIAYYKGLMDSRNYDGDSRIFEINFEDLIYVHDTTRKAIEAFLGLPEVHKKNSRFKPEVSINNTQLWKKYTSYSEDIKKIEKALPDFLYPFDRYSISPTFSSESF